MENDPNAEFYIPLIWQGDGAWPSPGYSTRGSMYGVGGIPHSQWGGFQEIVGGGGTTMYNSYINMYNQLVDDESPVEIQTGLGFDTNGDLLVQALVEVTGDITTTNNKIVYIIKWFQNAEYFCTVVGYANETFDLTSIGETGTYSYSFPMNASWEIEDITAVAMVQTYSGNTAILGAAQAQLTGLVAGIGSNVQSGPASLAVQFSSVSYPLTGIESWEWDIDGDGEYDYTEENPYHMYDTPGSYDVTLRIGMEGEYNEVTISDYITVTEDAVAEGVVSGVWHSDLGPYLVTGDITVNPNDLLEIEPGTEIIFENEAEFLVKGQLIADARDSDMIILRTESDWTGIHVKDSTHENIIAWCEISGATESAIYIENSDCDIINNLIHYNSGSILGAAIELLDVLDIEISGNLIANNTSTSLTGGISMTNCFPNVYNNIIVNNTAGTAGAFSIKQNSAPVLVNNTIANNVGVNGAFLLFSSQPTLINCIVQNEGSIFAAIASAPTVLYSCISGGYNGEGNIDVDPMFVAPSEGSGSGFDGMIANWQLAVGSECIDAGDPDVVYNDLDGTQNDMGAYGWNGFPDYEPGTYTYGDVDSNGVIDAYDASLVLMFAVGIPTPIDPFPVELGDVDGNGFAEAYDAALILQYVVGIINVFPVETRINDIPLAELDYYYDGSELVITANGELYSASLEFPFKLEAEKLQINDQFISAIWGDKVAIASAYPVSGEVLRIPVEDMEGQQIFTSANSIRGELMITDAVVSSGIRSIYPNPFNPETTIGFTLNKPGNVRLEIYNIKGQMIDKLADRYFDAGTHQITWNAEKFASGVYFVMFNNGDRNIFQKVVLMK